MERRSLTDLDGRRDFIGRHIGPDATQIATMLEAVGYGSLDELIDAAVPKSIRIREPLALHEPTTESRALAELEDIANLNQRYTSLIGMGFANTFLPPVLRRNILEAPGWYTAYTPYQPEISQGRLEALLTFQTMVIDLTGMEIANASLLDEATAAAEAMTMLRRISKRPASAFFVDADCHPQTINVVQTRAEPLGIEVVVGDPDRELIVDDVYAVLLQYPGSSGRVRDDRELIDRLREAGVMVAVAADPLALTLLTPPGEMGADVVVGTTQRFGVPLMFGGPHAAYMATRDAYKRHMPGRLVGVSKDTEGRVALRLALQTREQHIRREKATSNICTAQVLLAVISAMYAVYHGPEGLRTIAERVHRTTSVFAAGLRRAGLDVVNDSWFDTLTVRVPRRAEEIAELARERRINLRVVDPDTVGVTFDETSTPELIATLWEVFGVSASVAELDAAAPDGLPDPLRRTSEFLTHPVFHRYRSETEMMRYLRALQEKDIALDRSMIPLGSCTMKLNAAVELIPILWPQFADIHPYVPLDQAQGYLRLFEDLEAWLAEITGYDVVSLQPNSGAQGELAGLLAIRAYHQSRGEGHRDVCLIPASAHGTNPASATMAGMKVVVVATDAGGNIDYDDLVAKAEANSDRLAALMITYPSTHGVFEEHVTEVCEVIHAHGGQVYIDGANLNALVGLAKPGRFGGDVSHLNLHKTFTIPHGGGGPGVGPLAARAHLAPYLPGHPLVPDQPGPADGVGPVAAAPWGSAGILPIPWVYIRLMGAEGLTEATKVAILNANYVARSLRDIYPTLYVGNEDLVAHECILDVRHFKQHGVTIDDFAKRLIDYGFHAPTVSFPVAGTLMIEPTESESLRELDRFCDAMRGIHAEIQQIVDGAVAYEDSVLRHAPHPAQDLLAEPWDRSYSREDAAYPDPGLRAHKYWVPVSRIDAPWGDKHVICACPPMEAYEEGIAAMVSEAG